MTEGWGEHGVDSRIYRCPNFILVGDEGIMEQDLVEVVVSFLPLSRVSLFVFEVDGHEVGIYGEDDFFEFLFLWGEIVNAAVVQWSLYCVFLCFLFQLY